MFWTQEPELEARVVPTPPSSGRTKLKRSNAGLERPQDAAVALRDALLRFVLRSAIRKLSRSRARILHDRILDRLQHARATRMMVAWYRWVCAPTGPPKRPRPVVLRRALLRATKRHVSRAWQFWTRLTVARRRVSVSMSLICGIARRQYVRRVSRGFGLLRSATCAMSLQLALNNARRRAVAAALCRRFTCIIFRAWIALRVNAACSKKAQGDVRWLRSRVASALLRSLVRQKTAAFHRWTRSCRPSEHATPPSGAHVSPSAVVGASSGVLRVLRC